MNKKIMVLTAVLIISAYAMYPAAAATFTVNYNVQSLNTFTVQTATPQLNFTGNGQAQSISPDGTPLADGSWGNVNNTGNVAQTFKVNVDTTVVGIRLAVSNVPAMTAEKNVTISPGAWPGSTNVAPNGNVPMYFKAYYNVADGAYTQALTIGT